MYVLLFHYGPWTALGPWLSERFVHLASAGFPASELLRKTAGQRAIIALGTALSSRLTKPHHSKMSLPDHAYSGLSKTIHRRARNRFADSGNIPGDVAAHFPLRGTARHAPGGRPRVPCTFSG